LVCVVVTTPVVFGDYDFISANSASPLDGTGGVTVTCTSGYDATITLGQGNHPLGGSTDAQPLRQMSDGGANHLPYFLYQDAARTIEWGNSYETSVCTSGEISVYGRIPAGQNVPVGNYADVVVVTVNI
jgi:spore coat protein U-like protein